MLGVDEEMEQTDVLHPLGRSVSNTCSTGEEDGAASTSLIYSEDESMSDAYFLPQNKSRNELNEADWEEEKRTSLWGTESLEAAIETLNATEDTALLRQKRRVSPPLVARDVLWSILFLVHILLLAVCAARLGRDLLIRPAKHSIIKTANSTANAGPTIVVHESPVVETIFALGGSAMGLTALSAGFAVPVSFLSFGFLMLLDNAMIYIMLGLSNLFGLACVILGLSLQPYGGAAIAGFVLFVGTLSYTIHQWNHIGFSTVLLHIAVSSLRPDMGVVAGGAMVVFLAAMLLWEWASLGIIDSLGIVLCTKTASRSCSLNIENWDIGIIVVMMFSFTWITAVVINSVRVIAAGLTATWWFAPQFVPLGGCGTVIASRSVGRALSISFGSICLGSLVVGAATAWIDSLLSCCCCSLHPVATKNGMMLPASRSDSMIMALGDVHETAGMQRDLNRLCHRVRWYCSSWNKFAFCFVGMYGFGLTESGSRAVKLFRSRRWLKISKDSLLSYTLFWAVLAIALSTGLFSVLVDQTDGNSSLPLTLSFVIGATVGSIVSAILFFGVVGSALNTVLTCFAVSPAELEKNHPTLGQAMMESWSRRVSE